MSGPLGLGLDKAVLGATVHITPQRLFPSLHPPPFVDPHCKSFVPNNTRKRTTSHSMSSLKTECHLPNGHDSPEDLMTEQTPGIQVSPADGDPHGLMEQLMDSEPEEILTKTDIDWASILSAPAPVDCAALCDRLISMLDEEANWIATLSAATKPTLKLDMPEEAVKLVKGGNSAFSWYERRRKDIDTCWLEVQRSLLMETSTTTHDESDDPHLLYSVWGKLGTIICSHFDYPESEAERTVRGRYVDNILRSFITFDDSVADIKDVFDIFNDRDLDAMDAQVVLRATEWREDLMRFGAYLKENPGSDPLADQSKPIDPIYRSTLAYFAAACLRESYPWCE